MKHKLLSKKFFSHEEVLLRGRDKGVAEREGERRELLHPIFILCVCVCKNFACTYVCAQNAGLVPVEMVLPRASGEERCLFS